MNKVMESKINLVRHFLVIVVIWMSISFSANGQQQQNTVRPGTGNIGGNINTGGNVNTSVSTVRPQTTAGNIVVHLQTESNILSVINAHVADTGTIRPIEPLPTTSTSRPGTTAHPIGTSTTTRPIGTTARPIGTTARPFGTSTTAKPILISTTARPLQITTAPTCPLVNIMALKTGYLPIINNPCQYVACIRSGDILYCSIVKCDLGYAFSVPANQCLPSPLCAPRPT